MKTPLEKLISAFDDSMGFMNDGFVKSSVHNCKEMAILFLKDEREAIEDAYDSAQIIRVDKNGELVSTYEDGRDYFNKTFK
jgi:hypothetical protein